MEAGLEHLSWAGGTLRSVDLLLVVVEAQAKVLLTATRVLALARQLGIRSVALVGNRVHPEDKGLIDDFARHNGCEVLGLVPDDEAVRRADQLGVCPIDLAPDSSAVAAIQSLGAVLEHRFLATDAA